MATPNQETPGANAPPAGEEKPSESAPSSSTSGGLKGWLPLIVTTITMPVLAYATTVFVLLPKMQKAAAAVSAAATNTTVATTPASQSPSAEAKPPPSASPGKPKAKTGEGGKEARAVDAALKTAGVKVTSDGKTTVPLNKILVNISGSMGSRYLLTSLTLASDKEGFGELILNNEAQLVDLASSVLSAKTIADLEKPEARTVIRTELETVFNNALGAGTVQDVYFTEFAVQ